MYEKVTLQEIERISHRYAAKRIMLLAVGLILAAAATRFSVIANAADLPETMTGAIDFPLGEKAKGISA